MYFTELFQAYDFFAIIQNLNVKTEFAGLFKKKPFKY